MSRKGASRAATRRSWWWDSERRSAPTSPENITKGSHEHAAYFVPSPLVTGIKPPVFFLPHAKAAEQFFEFLRRQHQ